MGKLTSAQAERVEAQARRRGVSFPEAALAMGVIRHEDLMSVLSRQYSYPILDGNPESARFSSELVVGHEPFGAAAEVIRSIRSSLAVSVVKEETRSFLITGPRKGAGSSFFAGNLALAFAQMSLPTLLVDANLRTPRIAEMFGIRPFVGLSETLGAKNVDHPPIISNVIQGLSILPAGAVPPNPQELLASTDFLALTNNLQRAFGIVIYDTAAGMDYADAHVVASRVGAAVVVARRHKTAFNDVSHLVQKLRGINCKLLGSVLNTF
jgi:protein-tyrosine kinase